MGNCCSGAAPKITCVLAAEDVQRIEELAEAVCARKPLDEAVAHVAKSLARTGMPYTAPKLLEDVCHDKRVVHAIALPDVSKPPPIDESVGMMVATAVSTVVHLCNMSPQKQHQQQPSQKASSPSHEPHPTAEHGDEPSPGKSPDKKSILQRAVESVKGTDNALVRQKKAQKTLNAACEGAVYAKVRAVLENHSSDIQAARIAGICEIGAPLHRKGNSMRKQQRKGGGGEAQQQTTPQGTPTSTPTKSAAEKSPSAGNRGHHHATPGGGHPGDEASAAPHPHQHSTSPSASSRSHFEGRTHPSAGSLPPGVTNHHHVSSGPPGHEHHPAGHSVHHHHRLTQQGQTVEPSHLESPGGDFSFDDQSSMFWSPSLRLYYEPVSQRYWSPDDRCWWDPAREVWLREDGTPAGHEMENKKPPSVERAGQSPMSAVGASPSSRSRSNGGDDDVDSNNNVNSVHHHQLSPQHHRMAHPPPQQHPPQHHHQHDGAAAAAEVSSRDPATVGLGPEWTFMEETGLWWNDEMRRYFDDRTREFGNPDTNVWSSTL